MDEFNWIPQRWYCKIHTTWAGLTNFRKPWSWNCNSACNNATKRYYAYLTSAKTWNGILSDELTQIKKKYTANCVGHCYNFENKSFQLYKSIKTEHFILIFNSFTTDFLNPCQARINVKNLSDHSVLFRVKFKYPEIFFAHPAFGELIPGNQYWNAVNWNCKFKV